jgi:hypothetical protein
VVTYLQFISELLGKRPATRRSVTILYQHNLKQASVEILLKKRKKYPLQEIKTTVKVDYTGYGNIIRSRINLAITLQIKRSQLVKRLQN